MLHSFISSWIICHLHWKQSCLYTPLLLKTMMSTHSKIASQYGLQQTVLRSKPVWKHAYYTLVLWSKSSLETCLSHVCFKVQTSLETCILYACFKVQILETCILYACFKAQSQSGNRHVTWGVPPGKKECNTYTHATWIQAATQKPPASQAEGTKAETRGEETRPRWGKAFHRCASKTKQNSNM